MNLAALFGRSRSAPQARDRLQALLAYERGGGGELAATLQQEIVAIIARRVPIDRDKVVVRLDPRGEVSLLAIDVEVPRRALAR